MGICAHSGVLIIIMCLGLFRLAFKKPIYMTYVAYVQMAVNVDKGYYYAVVQGADKGVDV